MNSGNLLILTTPSFDKKSEKLLSNDSLNELLDYLEINPEAGQLIIGTGGIRKLRWTSGKNNKGKSGGVRVLYHYSKNILLLLITLYNKSEKENISESEKKTLKLMVDKLLKELKEEI